MLGTPQNAKIDLLHFEVMAGDKIILCSESASVLLGHKKINEIYEQSNPTNFANGIINFISSTNQKQTATAITICFPENEDTLKAKPNTTSPQDKFEALKQIPFFADLDYKEMTKIMAFIHTKKLAKNSNIVVEDTVGNEMYIILKGTADVSIKNKVVKNLESGDFFGEISLIDNAPRTASIMATSDIEVLTLSRKDFYYILTHDSQLSVKLLWMFTQTLATRLRAANLTLPDKVKNKDSYSVDSNSAITLKFD